jgi:hypothetical protein
MDCHCRDCQYASGGSHTTAVVVPAAAFKLTLGQPTRYESPGDSGQMVARHFCAVCGSPLFSQPPAEYGLVVIKAASLDDPSWLSVQGALYVSSAQPWAAIDRSKLVFDKMPPRA